MTNFFNAKIISAVHYPKGQYVVQMGLLFLVAVHENTTVTKALITAVDLTCIAPRMDHKNSSVQAVLTVLPRKLSCQSKCGTIVPIGGTTLHIYSLLSSIPLQE